jgi:hypothetical protein
MAKKITTAAQAKASVIAKIKRRKGLYENCGQVELSALREAVGPCDEQSKEFAQWVDNLDYTFVQQYL